MSPRRAFKKVRAAVRSTWRDVLSEQERRAVYAVMTRHGATTLHDLPFGIFKQVHEIIARARSRREEDS